MRQFFTWLMQIHSDDEDVRRRGHNLVIIVIGLAVAMLPFFPLMLTNTVGTIIVLFLYSMFVAMLALARRGYIMAGALMLILGGPLVNLGNALIRGQLGTAGYIMVIPLLIASLCLRPRYIWLLLGAFYLALLGVVQMLPNDPLSDPSVLTAFFLLGVTALISFLGASTSSKAFEATRQARAEAEAAAQALSRANADLEQTVSERTTALHTALDEVHARADQQARLLDELAVQRNTIRDLSVPVIPISATTLIMPLVGALDTTRLQLMQEQALSALQQSSAHHLILDITGVPTVDQEVGAGLLEVIQAARLLGAQVMLVGIRPEVAQTIVGLDLNLEKIATITDLQSALSRIPQHVVRSAPQHLYS